MKYYLAQANAAQMNGTLESPIMEGMTSQIQRINNLAETSPGFVWRIASVTNDELRPIAEDLRGIASEEIFFNMSVWNSIEALRQFTFESIHRSLLHRKLAWIVPTEEASNVLWWIEANHRPNISEASEKLRLIRSDGPTESAFDFQNPHPAPINPA